MYGFPKYDPLRIYTHVIKSKSMEGYYCGTGFTSKLYKAFTYNNKKVAEDDIKFIAKDESKSYGELYIGYVSCNHYGHVTGVEKEIPEDKLNEFQRDKYLDLLLSAEDETERKLYDELLNKLKPVKKIEGNK